MPSKRYKKKLIGFLTRPEIEALLASPDLSTWVGRSDRVFLLVAVQTGLRLSEMTSLRAPDVVLGAGAHVRCMGKGRKERCTPLAKQAIDSLKQWLRERGAPLVTFCSQAQGVLGSARTECSSCWPSTSLPRDRSALRLRTNGRHRMCFATRLRWSFCKPASTVP
jgi:site-specific recombinase XerD